MKLFDRLTLPPEQLSQHTDIPITIVPDTHALYRHWARNMADTIIKNNRDDKPTSLILPVGPVDQYPILADLINRERIDLRRLFTFNMDEYLDWQGKVISETHPLSFRRTMMELFWCQIDESLRLPLEQMHFPNPQQLDVFDEALDRHGPVDVCYASVGYHGHVAFNEGIVSRWYKVPESQFLLARTHIVPLAHDTIIINSSYELGGNCEHIPPMAVTIGMHDILAAKRIECCFYCGSWQRTVFRRTLFQDCTVEYPGTFLKRHADLRISLDADTAACPKIVCP